MTFRTAVAEVEKLRQRVLDDGLRALVLEVQKAASRVVWATTKSAAEHHFDELTGVFDGANTQIGERVRRLFSI